MARIYHKGKGGAFSGTQTRYYSISPADFTARFPDSYQIDFHTSYVENEEVSSKYILAPVHLPQNAVITSVIIYGNDTGDVWYLRRSVVSSSTDVVMATANVNTADSSISYATIDNSGYTYTIITGVDAGKVIYGGKITYTVTADNQG